MFCPRWITGDQLAGLGATGNPAREDEVGAHLCRGGLDSFQVKRNHSDLQLSTVRRTPCALTLGC